MSWDKKENTLEKTFTFNNFEEALDFVNEVGKLAELLDHHPDILLHSYKKVTITTTTHSKGEITSKDYQLSEEIDKLFK